MTDIKRNVEIIFSGKDDLSKNIKNISLAMSGLAAAGLAYAFSESVKLESALIDLAKVMGDQPAELEAAKKAAFDLAMTYGVSAENALESMANFKQAGFTAQEAMQLTKDALDLVIAGDLEAAEASEILVSTLKGFGAPASDAARLIDILNEVSNNYATSVTELGAGMARLSPIASQMGFSFEETAGILTPVIEVFRSGDEAAVALKTGLLKLIDDSKPVQDALRKIGVSQRDANGDLRSGKDILYDVSKAFEAASDADKLFLTQQLVGINQAPKMVTVFSDLAKVTDITASAMGAAGSAAKEVNLRLASTEVTLKAAKEGVSILAAAFGDHFRENVNVGLKSVIEFEREMLEMIQSGHMDAAVNIAIGSVKMGVNALQTAFDSFVLLLAEGVRKIAGFAEGIADIVPGLGGVSEKLDGFNEGLDEFIANVKENQARNFGEMVDGWDVAFGNLGDTVDGLPKDKVIDVKADTTQAVEGVQGVGEEIDKKLPKDLSVPVAVHVDQESVKNSQEYLIKQMEAQHDLLSQSIKYRAEVDMAQIEASTKVFEASIDSVNTGLTSTAELIQTAMEGLDSTNFTTRWEARKLLEQEMEMRREEFALQKQLIEAKIRALESGEFGKIEVDSTGLEPALEMVMWHILEKVQVRATEEAASFLLGI